MRMWIVHSPASTAGIYKHCFYTRSLSSESQKKFICGFHGQWIQLMWKLAGISVLKVPVPRAGPELDLCLKCGWVPIRKSWGLRDGAGAACRAVAVIVVGRSLIKQSLGFFYNFPCSMDLLSTKAVNRIKRDGWRLKLETKLVQVRGLSNRKMVIHLAKQRRAVSFHLFYWAILAHNLR